MTGAGGGDGEGGGSDGGRPDGSRSADVCPDGGRRGARSDGGVRYKVVPPVRDRRFLLAARDALPLVPGTVEDCCTRIRDRTAVPSRDEARECLTFLRALGLAAETDRGYHRTRTDRDDLDLAAAFRENVLGARELLDAAAAGPLTTEGAFAELRPLVPRWERDRRDDWESVWRERAERLLGWAVELGLAERTERGYRTVTVGDDG